MEKEIIDYDLAFKNRNDIPPKLVNWISIIILWLGIAYCFINGTIIDVQVIAGIVLLVIATITTYFKYNIGVEITLGIMALGVFNLVKYFPISYSLSFGIGDLGVTFEMLIFLIGVIHYFTNREVLSGFLRGITNREVSEEELQAAKRRKIDWYKSRFSNKNTDELKIIANNKNLVSEAIKAAEELVESKA